jgi:hypothetical protein
MTVVLKLKFRSVPKRAGEDNIKTNFRRYIKGMM